MRREEAKALAQWVLELGLPPGTVCLNIGSSTAQFRQVEQPHIHDTFIRPLEEAGLRFVHCDLKDAPGVDEIGSVFDPEFQARLKNYKAGIIVCSNLLEHLEDPKLFARACGNLVETGAVGIFSVPSSYPYHPDPIDTKLRPKPDELAGMLPGWTAVKCTEIEAGSYWEDLRRSGQRWRLLAKQVARAALPFYRPKHWHSIVSRLAWLGRPYRVSMVLMKTR
jgi:hypothetical protein